jgi:hypothetical protein
VPHFLQKHLSRKPNWTGVRVNPWPSVARAAMMALSWRRLRSAPGIAVGHMQCIVCETEDAKLLGRLNDCARFDCRRCGLFVLGGSADVTLETRLNEKPPLRLLRRSLMSHTLRRMQQPGNKPLRVITDEELPTFWRSERLPTPQQQADNLILWIGDNQETSFATASMDRSAIAAWIGLHITPDDVLGWKWLNTQLEPKRFYELNTVEGRVLNFRLTMDGWERYESLKKTEIESRSAFMAMKFGQSDLDRVVDECFRPAVIRTGFKLQLLTEGQPAGLIDDQLRAAIVRSRFVISDLTHGSPGAYWEAGFGEGLGRDVIYTCEKSAWEKQGTHFDTNHLTTIIWILQT